MILDKQSVFSTDQAITSDSASENVIKTNGDIAKGTPVEVLIQVTQAFATLTSLNIKVQTSTDEAFTSPETLAETGDIPVASLVKGYRAPIKFLPRGIKSYLRLYYDVTGSDATTGKVTAGIVHGVQESFTD